MLVVIVWVKVDSTNCKPKSCKTVCGYYAKGQHGEQKQLFMVNTRSNVVIPNASIDSLSRR